MHSLLSLRVLLLVLLAWNAPAALGQVQGVVDNRMIIATDLLCRDQPNRSSAPVGAFNLGDRVITSRMQEVDGDVWLYVTYREVITRPFDYSSRPRDCWVFGPMTTVLDEVNPEQALVTLADHALDNDQASFEDFVAAQNVLEAELFSSLLDSSPRLQARRLRLIDAALSSRMDSGDPLTWSWIQSHGELLRYWSIGLAWYIPSDVYWQAYESFEGVEGAEDIAWAGANAKVFFDECYTYCNLDLIADTRMQYWIRFPDGQYINDAMPFAIRRAELAGKYCVLATTGYLQMNLQAIQELLEQLRASLVAVAPSASSSLLTQLSVIERNCIDSEISDLNDPSAIPGLMEALGSGFSIVPRQLAGFGEQALPSLLEVIEEPDRDVSATRDALLALRFLVDLVGPDALSASALAEIRNVTEHWLARPGQSILTLGVAIDLAVLLDEPDLREVVQSLALDGDEVMARGVELESSVAFVQRRASERLAGRPPLPRP